MPVVGPDPTLNQVIADEIKTQFKNYVIYEAFEISGYRWVRGLKGWGWLTCVRFRDRDHLRTYVFLVRDGKVIDNRYAVETDACDAESYSPFGLLGPTGFGTQPLY